jgi:hypothetical protein
MAACVDPEDVPVSFMDKRLIDSTEVLHVLIIAC